MAFIGARRRNGCRKLFFGVRHADADAGAAGAGLDNAGKSHLADDLRQGRKLAGCHPDATGRADTGVLQKRFGNVLVHGKRTSEIAGAGVTDAVDVKRCLELSVFAHSAVERQKGHVCRAAEAEHVGTDQVTPPAGRSTERLKVGDLTPDGVSVGAFVGEKSVQIGVWRKLKTGVNVKGKHGVPPAPEGGSDQASGGKRYVTFRRKTAGKNHNIQSITPLQAIRIFYQYMRKVCRRSGRTEFQEFSFVPSV